ncbi:biliverdin-producing heme oxygenase [Spirosoma radiotolerans]|uniref:Heme oxygenase n=1 Tax=Spirosoma radiotolerans TaxID=1379870 RepID=A0A0E3V5T5_9BACT|nr:biliverdin-producing heme oxygenase [Spirosoma radiotolerans]AKD54437.1 heme oxygenase [Spirosoma radiotolerans]
MTNLLERLRQETRPLHEQTEQLFYTKALKNGTLSVAEYSHLLQTHLVFHQALESAIDRNEEFFRDYEPEVRRKTPWLLADLAHLPQALPVPMPELFADWSPVSLLGAAYVGEGSMLGGSVIGRMLQQNEAIKPLVAQGRFYQGYGSALGNNWKKFGAFLTQQGTPYADAVVAAADETFSVYQSIFLANRAAVLSRVV